MPDMDALSVNLPAKSTVKLPDASPVSSGYFTGMDLAVLLHNIDVLRQSKGLSDNALSKKAGREDAIRNLRRYASGGIKGMWTLDTLDAIATALGTTSWELLKPPGAIPKDEASREFVRSILREELMPTVKAKKSRRGT